MATISKPYTLSAGATIIASEHNSNYDTIYSEFNGSISNANLSASAGIVDTKLATISTSQKVNLTAVVATSQAQGDTIFASSSTVLARLAKDANATRYLSNTGSSNNPAWAQVNIINGLVIASQAQGDLIFADAATTFARLPAGTSGQFLKTQGAGANPVWANGGLLLLSTTTIASADNTGDITIAADKLYLVSLMGIVSNNNDDVPVVLINNSTTAGHYKDSASTDRSNIGLTNAAGTTIFGSNGTINCQFFINTFDNGAVKASVSSPSYIFVGVAGSYLSYAPLGIFLNAAPTSFRITNNRNFASLTVRVYEYSQ